MSHGCELTGATLPTTDMPVAAPGAGADPKRDLLAWQQAVVSMGRRAIVSPDPALLMHDAAILIAEMLGIEHSGTAELSADGQSLCLRLALGGRAPADVQETVGAAAGDSWAGYALQAAHPVALRDLSLSQPFIDPVLNVHGIRSLIAAPLMLPERPFGALAAFSSRPHDFDEEDVLLVETIAHLATMTIARRRTEEALVAQERLSTGVLETVASMVLVLDRQAQITYANPACVRGAGYGAAELQGRPIDCLLPDAEEAAMLRRLVLKPSQGDLALLCETRLKTKDGRQRRVAWSWQAARGSGDAAESIVVAGADITEDRPAAAEPQPAADGGSPAPAHKDRRRRPRRSYPYTQHIAPIIDGQLPDKDAFVEVQCNDIAAGGFSFLSATPPASDMLVVALGAPPNFTYLTVQVAHANRIRIDGQRMFLIGCNYVGRANY